MVQQQAQQLQQMTKVLEGVQKDVRRTVSVMQYNILASYLGKNTQPWFLYGADIDAEERAKIFACFNERRPDGTPKHAWPDYVTGILSAEEIAEVERYDAFFRWDFRRQKLLEQIGIMDPDVLSLVELDDHEFFADCLSDEWDSVFRKRPRASSADGCGIFWRKSKFEKLASEGFDMVDGNDDKGREKRDRSCVMVLLKWRVANQHILPLVVVSTHLAKDPYNKAQTAIRVRQVTQIMASLTEFTAKHQARHCPVVLLGDLNARHFGEIRGIARTVWQIKGEPVHKFLWGATDVNTGPTSVTKARHCRIDVVQYLSSHMEAASAQTTSHGITQKRSASGQVLDVLPVPKLDPGEAALTARHWHLTDTCCHCNVTTITTLPGRGTRSAAHRAAQSFPLPEYADWYLRLARAKVAKQFHTVIFVWHLRATYAHLLSHTIRVRCYHVSASAMASHTLQWIQRHAKDRWVQRAHEQMYRSRAAFKLKQLDAQFKFLNRSSVVLDLGCYAGGWSQVALQRTAGHRGGALVIGVDKVMMEPLEGQQFVQGDIDHAATMRQVESLLCGRQATVVLSDLAPKMIGNSIDDHLASVELSKGALRWALKFLRAEGWFVAKVFAGGALDGFKAQLAEHFAKAACCEHLTCPNSQAEGLEERERGGLPRLLGLSWPALRQNPLSKKAAAAGSQLKVMLDLEEASLPRWAFGRFRVIPNAEHPSDHFPVFVTFILKDGYEKHRDCARAWLECVAGREKVHPLTDEELRDAFEFFDRDRQECIHRRDLEEACLDLRCNFHVDVPKLLVDCFPNKQISFQNFLRAYEASLRSDRLRAVGDLECAFRYFAGEKESIEVDTLEAAFREITPISFSDEEVKDMIGRVSQDGSPCGKASVHLKDFCEVVCRATFPNREVVVSTGTESRTFSQRSPTKEISTRLKILHKTVSGQGFQDLDRSNSKGSVISEMPLRIDKHLAPPVMH
ncbi:rlmE [Symbiodinium natans]|uniref:rRNA methyltransferase 2, mitochondrial n=1 Tax=Symbiodinium natans TaxID=878477 RepID=A0A812TUR2_9DINO|nr:rlmE [Symbiodinium natans]